MKGLSVFILLLGFSSLWFFRESAPWIRLGLSSLGLILTIKIAALLWQRADGIRPVSSFATFLFLFFWPSPSLQGFTSRSDEPSPLTGVYFLESWLTFLAGCALLLVSLYIGQGTSTAWNYISLLALLMIIHLGLVEAMADGLRLLGFAVPSLFQRPYLANSLRDFWSLRWNRAFVDMNKIFIAGPLKGKVASAWLGFSIFVISGLLHELGISFADGVSWGRPLGYFVIQGLGMLAEKRFRLPLFVVLLWILLPVPLLFTPQFTNLYLGGLAVQAVAMANTFNFESILRAGFFVGAAAHLLVLCASVQVPARLGWAEEFKNLRPLNRKVFWTYGAYIFVIIIFMSAVSFTLGFTEQLHGLATKLWLIFISLFWWARIGTDFFYHSHEDWPAGALFKVGHIALTTLFATLATLYSLLVIFT